MKRSIYKKTEGHCLILLLFLLFAGYGVLAEGPGQSPFKPRDSLRLMILLDTVVIPQGQRFQLMAIITPPSQEKHFIMWKSLNDTIVGLDQYKYGEIRSKEKGKTYIVAYDYFNSKLADTCVVIVTNYDDSLYHPKPQLSISKDTLIMYVDEQTQLMASVNPPLSGGYVIEWESLDNSIVWLSDYGYLSALKEGTTSIVAYDSYDMSLRDTCVVFVRHRNTCNSGDFPVENKSLCTTSQALLYSENPVTKWYSSLDFTTKLAEGSYCSFTFNRDTIVSVYQTIQHDTCIEVLKQTICNFVSAPDFDTSLFVPFKSICIDSTYQLPYNDLRWYRNVTDAAYFYMGNGFPPGITEGDTYYYLDRGSFCENQRFMFKFHVKDCNVKNPKKDLSVEVDTLVMYVGDRILLQVQVKPVGRHVTWISTVNNVATVNGGMVEAISVGQSLIIASDFIDSRVADTCLVIVRKLKSCGNNDYTVDDSTVCTGTSLLLPGTNANGLWYSNKALSNLVGMGASIPVLFTSDSTVTYYHVVRADTCLLVVKSVTVTARSPKVIDESLLATYDTLCIGSTYVLPYPDLQWFVGQSDIRPAYKGGSFPGVETLGDTVFYLSRSSVCTEERLRFEVHVRDCSNDFVPKYLINGRLSQYFSISLPPVGVVLMDEAARSIDSVVSRDGSFVLKVPSSGQYTIKAQPIGTSDYLTTYYGNKSSFDASRKIAVTSYIKGIDIKMLTRQLLSESDFDFKEFAIVKRENYQVELMCDGCGSATVIIISADGKEIAHQQSAFPVMFQTESWARGVYIISVNGGSINKIWVKD